jgi:branched-chain amino acid transport system permease protein
MTSELTPVQKERIEQRRTRFTQPFFLLQLALILGLLAAPVFMPSFRVMDVVAKIMIFTVVVASFDLILGYTGILSLAHGMFFGIGAYALALVVHHSGGAQWYHLILAAGAAVAVSILLSLVISFFSLRVKAIFFAMVTLALAEFIQILSIQWSEFTMGDDGISFALPGILSVDWSANWIPGLEINGRLMTYYLILAVTVLLFAGMLRFVRSPVGRVLKSIRENEMRAVALGYKTFRYQMLSITFGSCLASLAGMLFAMWLCYVNPESVLGIGTMVNVLLMVLIGGLGTLYGSIIGVSFVNVSENWLPQFLKNIAALLPQSEIVTRLAERWYLYFGIFYILVIIFFPRGVIGTAREVISRRKINALEKD